MAIPSFGLVPGVGARGSSSATVLLAGASGAIAAAVSMVAGWMFVSDLIAAFTPVIPFALFALATARVVSICLTTTLLVILGMGRGLIGKKSMLRTTIETLAIAATAAGAGLLIGKLIPGNA